MSTERTSTQRAVTAGIEHLDTEFMGYLMGSETTENCGVLIATAIPTEMLDEETVIAQQHVFVAGKPEVLSSMVVDMTKQMLKRFEPIHSEQLFTNMLATLREFQP